MRSALTQDQFALVILLIQLGLIAAISTIFVRFDTFKRMLFNEDLGWVRKFYLMGLVGSIFALGVLARLIIDYQAADLTLAGAFLVGLLAGPTAGAGVGLIVGVWPMLFGEFLSLPFAVLCGLLGGTIFIKEKSLERRMDFSPFSVLRMPRYVRDVFTSKAFPPQILIIFFCVVLELLNIFLAKTYPREIYAIAFSHPVIILCIIVAAFGKIGIPLKIWNNTRVELLLGDSEKKLTEAKLEAIRSKLKPHFLFNTLNAIYSAIRVDPDKARSVVLRLSELLRFVLESKGQYSKLSDEIALVDSYLSIEEARFGQGKLRFCKELEEAALCCYVPAMLLQPIVENSIKHGISKKVQSGKIILSARRNENWLDMTIIDDGSGIDEGRLKTIKNEGIGLSSVEERLNALFAGQYQFDILSKKGSGTEVKIRIPAVTEVKE